MKQQVGGGQGGRFSINHPTLPQPIKKIVKFFFLTQVKRALFLLFSFSCEAAIFRIVRLLRSEGALKKKSKIFFQCASQTFCKTKRSSLRSAKKRTALNRRFLLGSCCCCWLGCASDPYLLLLLLPTPGKKNIVYFFLTSRSKLRYEVSATKFFF